MGPIQSPQPQYLAVSPPRNEEIVLWLNHLEIASRSSSWDNVKRLEELVSIGEQFGQPLPPLLVTIQKKLVEMIDRSTFENGERISQLALEAMNELSGGSCVFTCNESPARESPSLKKRSLRTS